MTSIVREPTVLPLAKISDADRHIIVRTILRSGGEYVTQALNHQGNWVDRPSGFEADAEVTFLVPPQEPPTELPAHLSIVHGCRLANIPTEDATVEKLTRLHREALAQLSAQHPRPWFGRRWLNHLNGILSFALVQR